MVLIQNLRYEEDIEAELSSRRGLFRNIQIAREEYFKFGLLGAMFFIIGFIYSFMRILKDMFVMEKQDASCFNFIKIFYILPCSFIIILGVNILLQKRSVAKILNLCLIIFISLFIFFGTFIVFEDILMFDNSGIKNKYKDSNKFIRDLVYTLSEPIATGIYITAELWGSIILSYLFLSYLNELCSEGQHNRFIPPLFILTSISLLVSAIVTTGMIAIKKRLDNEQLKWFMGSFFFIEAGLGIIILFLKYILEQKVLTVPLFIPKARGIKKPKPKVSFRESIKIMLKSKFLLAMCGIVFFYNALYNLVETVYKFGIKAAAEAQHIKKSDYSAKFNNFEQYLTSIVVILLNMTSFNQLSDTRGWTFVAMISPIIGIISLVGIFGIATYNTAVENESFSILNVLFHGSPHLILENILGITILSSMKIFKYSAFDVTKERISMKIEDRYRAKFKSIYDGIFNKLGKSGGSIYGIFINSIFIDIDPRQASPITSIIGAIFIFLWVSGIYYLGSNYNSAVQNNASINIDLMDDESTTEIEVTKKTKEITLPQ